MRVCVACVLCFLQQYAVAANLLSLIYPIHTHDRWQFEGILQADNVSTLRARFVHKIVTAIFEIIYVNQRWSLIATLILACAKRV